MTMHGDREAPVHAVTRVLTGPRLIQASTMPITHEAHGVEHDLLEGDEAAATGVTT